VCHAIERRAFYHRFDVLGRQALRPEAPSEQPLKTAIKITSGGQRYPEHAEAEWAVKSR